MVLIAVLAENLYDTRELWYPTIRMKEAGHTVHIVGSGSASQFQSKDGVVVKPDMNVQDVNPDQYDAVIIPGGFSPDYMRRVPEMVEFVKNIGRSGTKPVAAICHGGWMLISAKLIKGRKVTSYFSIKDDMMNAGATWVDKPVVVDGNIITSRNPDDLPNFCQEILKQLN
ncbi:MAG: type 1 glutamine amidotransferase [Candidatus Lokiarchaeota archaeon]|nr:type 1 glutamine amidotransferase [Candidatus Lokiarchaeota archaeon]